MILREGMRRGDLEDMVLPMLTVDEYESKIDDNAIVIGFFVKDPEAANELNRFIQKSHVSILSCEVSPAPDQHGFYIVFVDFTNSVEIVDDIESVLSEVSQLALNDEWQMHVRGYEGVRDWDSKLLTKRFEQLRLKVIAKNLRQEKMMEFFNGADVKGVRFDKRYLIVEGSRQNVIGKFVDFGDSDILLKRNKLTESAISFDTRDVTLGLAIQTALGEGWSSFQLGGVTVISKNNSDQILILSEAAVRR